LRQLTRGPIQRFPLLFDRRFKHGQPRTCAVERHPERNWQQKRHRQQNHTERDELHAVSSGTSIGTAMLTD